MPRAVCAMVQLGYTNGEFEEDNFLRVPSFLSFGYGAKWVDSMTRIPGVTFEECSEGATVVTYDGVSNRFINLAALRRNKLVTGQPQDLIDLKNLPPPTSPEPLADRAVISWHQ